MSIQIQINGIDALKGQILDLPKKLESSVLAQMSQIAYDKMQEGAGRHSKEGKLFASIYNRSIPHGREVGHDPQMAPHALWVNFGTKPHPIFPKGASLTTRKELYGPSGTQRELTAAGKLKPMPGGRKLVLRWAKGDKFFFSQYVNHPGYIGDNYALAAADEAIRNFATIVDKALKEQA